MRFLYLLLPLFSLSATAATLDEKLENQWRRYDKAQARLLERAAANQITSRDEWEKVIAPAGEFAFTPADMAELRERQRNKIESARKNAVARSVIDFEGLRARGGEAISAFCAAVPKGGMLHIHPGGTFSRQLVNELFQRKSRILPVAEILDGIAQNKNAWLYAPEIEWLSSLGASPSFDALSGEAQARFRDFLFLPPGKQPFPRFNSVFYFLGSAVEDADDYEFAFLDFAKRAVRQGVIYVEFTTSYNPVLASVLEKIEAQTGLMIRVNFSFNRTRAAEDLGQKADILLAQAPSPWLVGIDFLDNEDGNPAFEKGQLLYGKVLAAVRSGGSRLHRTMHAGELGDVRNPRDAMLMGAERLGHGVNLADDLLALEYAALKKVPIETNLSSNLRLTKVEDIAHHPFLDYLRLGLPVSLSTDDEGIFDTDIQRECELALARTNITYAEFKEMAFHSLGAAFAAPADKTILRAKLEKAFVAFEGRAFLK